METKLYVYLLAGIIALTTFAQCDSVTSSEPDANLHSKESIELPELDLISPANNATNQSTQIELTWNKIKGAKNYEIQLSTSQDFDSTLVDSIVPGTSYQPSELETGTHYFWHVKPHKENYNGPPLDWSETWEFTTADGKVETVTVELQSPTDGQQLDTTSPTFDWSSVSESAEYHYQLSTDESFSDVLKDTVSDTSGVHISGLNSGAQYYWRVSPILDSATGTWSEVFGFTTSDSATDTTALPAPVQTSPNDGATSISLKPTFEWESVQGADHYILHANSIDPSEMVIETTVNGISYTPENNLDPGTTHDWRVRAVKDGVEGNWSDIHRFTTTSESSGTTTVSLTSPSEGATDQPASLTLAWEALSGIGNYQVQLATENTFSSPIADKTVGSTSYDVSGLSKDQTYYWRVQADGDGDTGNWSSVWSFSTQQSTQDGEYQNSAEGDRQALVDMYNATNGDNWNNNSGWLNGNPSDSWYGVEVDANGRVVRLNLRDNNLTGSLPESMGNLTKVTYLNLKQNHISGSIPTSIGNMSSLTHLLLNGRTMDMNVDDPHHPGKPVGGSWASDRSNNFSGNLPSSIGNLTNLVWLEINGSGKYDSGETGLTGAIPSELGNLVNLKGIHLAYNSLTSVPDLSRLTNLVHLTIGDNAMSGEYIPSSLGNLTKLKFIWMDNMGLVGDVPDLSKLTDLRIVTFAQNNLTGSFPNYMIDGTMPNINIIAFSWNENFGGRLLKFGETNLAALQLNGTAMSGTIPESITTQRKMINLNLGWSNFEGDFPSDLTGMYRLRHIYANDNNFTGSVPKVDTSNDKLDFLHFQNNKMSKEVPASLADIHNLPRIDSGDLNVSNNDFTDTDLADIINALKSEGALDILNY